MKFEKQSFHQNVIYNIRAKFESLNIFMTVRQILLKNARPVLPSGNPERKNILVENDLIVEISDEESVNDVRTIDLDGLKLFPGFIDVHIHGAVGVDTNAASADDLLKVAEYLAARGTTTWLPTFVPDSDENYQRQIRAVEDLIKMQADLPIAQAVGVHYEGVFANTQMCGALRPEYFKTFSGSELNDLPTLEKGVHLTTYAPEISGGIELTKELTRRNWIPSIGHTRADSATLERAFEAGAKHITHLFNAMTGVHHRDIGVAGWALTKDEISCEIIADGVHVHPEMLKLARRNKPADKLLLVSDAVAPTGLGDGDFEIWGERVSVVNGKTQNERGNIAGSVITLLDAVKMYLALGASEWEVSRMASANPARLLGLEKTHGSIEIGKRADLVALDANGNVALTVVGGKVLQRRDAETPRK
jgi:N-acetylglucosamine-6-phosphate deacetylase